MRLEACLVAVCLFFPAAAAAGPSPSGVMGNINTPSADVLRPGQVAAGVYGVQHGVVAQVAAAPLSGVELGIAWLPQGDGLAAATRLDVKTSLLAEAIMLPGVVFGVEDVTDERERSPYMAVSKTGPLGFRLHLGVGGGRFDGAFATLEKTFRPSRHRQAKKFAPTTLLLEYDGRDFNYGARAEVGKGVKLEGGYRQQEQWYVGLSVMK